MHVVRQTARQAKAVYENAIIQRSNSQREVNDLLQRKSNWTDSDVSRFTALVREDHLKEQEEALAKTAVSETEDAVDREFGKLMRSILARYHEEQVWSDKIRSASTYGSLVVLGLNLLVFIVAITLVEPWKRRRLAQALEKQIVEMSLKSAAMVEDGLTEIGRHLEEQRSEVQTMWKQLQEESRRGDRLGEVELVREAGKAYSKDEFGRAVAVSVVAAGFVGWLARSWFGI